MLNRDAVHKLSVDSIGKREKENLETVEMDTLHSKNDVNSHIGKLPHPN